MPHSFQALPLEGNSLILSLYDVWLMQSKSFTFYNDGPWILRASFESQKVDCQFFLIK